MSKKVMRIMSALMVAFLITALLPLSSALAYTNSNCTFVTRVSSDSSTTPGSSVTVNAGDKVYVDIYISQATTSTDTSGINYGLYKIQYDGDNFSIGTTSGTDYSMGTNAVSGWSVFDYVKSGSGTTSYVEAKVGDAQYGSTVLVTSGTTEYHVLRYVFTASSSATANIYDFKFATVGDSQTSFTQLGSYDGNLFTCDATNTATTFLATATDATATIASVSSDNTIKTIAGKSVTTAGTGTTASPEAVSVIADGSKTSISASDIVANDSGATVTFYGTNTDWSTTATSVDLTTSSQTVYAKVVSTTSVAAYYAISIKRAASTVATLATICGSSFTAASGTGTSADPYVVSESVASTVSQFTSSNYTLTDSSSTATLYSDSAFSTTSTGISLTAGTAVPAYVKVLAEDTTTATYYKINVARAAVVSALSSIEITTQPTKTDYFVGDTLDTTGMAVTATYEDNSKAAADGFTTDTTTLSSAGTKTVTVSYTAGSVTKTATFTVNVYEKNALKNLVVSGATLSPTFAAGTILYSASVSTSTITVTPTLADTSAKVTINGSASGSVTLTEGSNTVTIVVTPSDTSVSAKTYTINVSYSTSSGGYIGGGISTTSKYPVSQADQIVSQLGGSSSAVEADMSNTTVVDSKILTALAAQDSKTLTLSANDYKWVIKGSDVTNATVANNYNMGVNFQWGKLNEITAVPNGANSDDLAVQFSIGYSGTLPGTMTLEFGTDTVKNPYNGKALYFYYINEETGSYDYKGTVSVGSNGSVAIPFTHASKYLLTTKRILTDISGHWAYSSIMNMVKADVVSGNENGMFEPDKGVTRAEFAKMVATAFGYASTSAQASFSDVSSSDWFSGYVNILCQNGIMTGKTATTFAPNETLTREQMAAVLYRVLQKKGYQFTAKAGSSFNDGSCISSYAAEAINTLTANSIIKGMDNNCFGPSSTASKAQVATTLDRVISIAK